MKRLLPYLENGLLANDVNGEISVGAVAGVLLHVDFDGSFISINDSISEDVLQLIPVAFESGDSGIA